MCVAGTTSEDGIGFLLDSVCIDRSKDFGEEFTRASKGSPNGLVKGRVLVQ